MRLAIARVRLRSPRPHVYIEIETHDNLTNTVAPNPLGSNGTALHLPSYCPSPGPSPSIYHLSPPSVHPYSGVGPFPLRVVVLCGGAAGVA